jgi:alkaline phosphatase D
MTLKNKTILGGAQLAWIEKQVQSISNSGTRWQLIAQPLVVQEKQSPNYEKAIASALDGGAKGNADEWQKFLASLRALPEGKKKRAGIVSLVAGRYKINLSFDDWMGYAADRERLLAALATDKPTATLVYGGDTHNGWAGALRDKSGKVVAVEFDGMSVSSPGIEYYEPRFPHAFEAAAWKAANGDLTWADTHNRGFMLVSLSKDSHHVEYRGVETKIRGKSESTCLSAFRVTEGTLPKQVDCHDSRRPVSLMAQGLGVAEAPAPAHPMLSPAPARHPRLQSVLRRGASSLLSST